MKIYTFTPKKYNLFAMLKAGFVEHGHSDITNYDYMDDVPRLKKIMYAKSTGLPAKYRQSFKNKLVIEANIAYTRLLNRQKPDLIIIYNNQLLLPETLEKYKKQGGKIVFYLGDNPLFSNTFDYNLTILKYADLICSPDSFWSTQLAGMGIKNIQFSLMGIPEFPDVKLSIAEKNNYAHDITFIGDCLNYSWGYKRLLFLDSLSGLDMKIYASGKGWEKWMSHFPRLVPHIEHAGRLPFDKMLKLMKACKVFPVETNPGLPHGIHLRTFEAIKIGILPILENQADIPLAFTDAYPPNIKNYSELRDVAQYYIKHDKEREELLASLQVDVKKNINPQVFTAKLLEYLA